MPAPCPSPPGLKRLSKRLHSKPSWPALCGPSILSTALFVACVTGATAAEIKDGSAAIKQAQHVCRLETPALPGQWQVALRKNAEFGDEWHVWFGKDKTEPLCGFS